MDRIATYGVADRIREAGGRDGRVSADMARQADLDWLDRLIDWQPLADTADFLDGLRADLSNAGIVVFTPAGTPVKLPAGSTAVDFAYAVSPETAGTAVGVLVNGRRKAMENRLSHGQVVDLITGPYADPPDSWLTAARSGQARTHLKAAIALRQAEEAGARGHAQVAAAASAAAASAAAASAAAASAAGAGGPDLRDAEDDGTAFSAARRLGYPDLDALYEAVGRGDLTPAAFLAALTPDPAVTD
jgi:(p)ppGpp synthase/HD superfamily hydrolase